MGTGGRLMLRLLRFDRIGKSECRGRYEQQQGENPLHAQNKRLALRCIAAAVSVGMKQVESRNKIQKGTGKENRNAMAYTGFLYRLRC
jgi:hypothetical protein